MTDAIDIWAQRGRLTLGRENAQPGIDLPPVPADGDDAADGPLRVILLRYLSAPREIRSLYSLQLESGQTYNSQDTDELLAREDCPIA